MSAPKHTPEFPQVGTVSTNEACGCGVDVTDRSNPHIGSLKNPWRVRYCAKHAAAPELLEALENMVAAAQAWEYPEAIGNMMPGALAALAKARGES